MHDPDLGHIDAEDFVRDLRQRGLEALAVRMHADAQFESAVGRDPRRGLLVSRHHRNAPAIVDRRAMRRLLAIDRKSPTPMQPSVRLAPLLARPDGVDVDRGQRRGAAIPDSRRCRNACW